MGIPPTVEVLMFFGKLPLTALEHEHAMGLIIGHF